MLKLPRFLITAVAALLLVSCAAGGQSELGNGGTTSANDGAEWSYTFSDSTGADVTLTARPKKVAVLFSSYADIWVTAGGNVDITVGEAVERGFAGDSAVLADAGAGHTTIDLETLTSESPDLVIGTADYACQTNAVDFCRSVGIPAALFRVESFSDYLGVLEIFCNITGEDARYETYGIKVKEQIDALFDRIASADRTPSILFVRAGSSAKSTKAKTTSDNFACVMLSELGARNIADTNNELSSNLSLEAILVEDPDYLFITTMGDEAAAKEYMNSLLAADGWKDLSCVKENRYFYLPKDLFHFKPNARWAEAYEYLAELLYPEKT